MTQALVPFNKRKSNFDKVKRDASYCVISEHVIQMCREYAKSNSIPKAAKKAGFSEEEVMKLLCEPKVIEVLQEEIEARSSAAKVSKDILFNRLNVISEKIQIALETDRLPIEKAAVLLKTLGDYSEKLAKLKGYYKEEKENSISHEKEQLLQARKNIFWGEIDTSTGRDNTGNETNELEPAE